MDPAILSVAISYFMLGTGVGIAYTLFLAQPSMARLQYLEVENQELNEEIEDLQKEAERMKAVRDLVDRLYEADDECEEEEVVPTLPPPPPAVRCYHRLVSNESYTMSPVFTP
jgi:hypothetical protein